MKQFYALFIIILPALLKAQVTETFSAAKDNTIYSEFSTNSNGTGQYLFVGRNAAANASSIQRALINFDLSSIPTSAVVTAATLTLYVNKSAPTATGIGLYKATSEWGEGTSDAGGLEARGAPALGNDATWLMRMSPSTAWSSVGGDFVSSVTFTTNVSAGITTPVPVVATSAGLIADLQSWVNNPSTNFGWIIKSSDENAMASVKRFSSREDPTSNLRPTLSVTYTSGIVPVTLKNFAVSPQQTGMLLTWKTESEVNNSYFDVEHSENATNFKSVGRVSGNGLSTIERSYSFLHTKAAAGKNYYRLSQHDFNGAVKYSPVLLADNRKSNGFKIVPNIVSETLNITSSEFIKGTTYSIISSGGKVVKKGMLGNQPISVGNLSKGLYYISLQTTKGLEIGTFFKK